MYADVVFHEDPHWSQRPGRRLALNFLPATIIVLGVLASLRMPLIEQSLPMTELIVRILVDEVAQVVESLPVETVPAEAPNDTPEMPAVPLAAPDATAQRTPTDWYALIPEAVSAALDARPREYSVNPGFDERRRHAAEQFAPGEAPVEQPIWEHVERDTMGRALLRSGDCYRVIDDPNVGSRDAFLTFGQFMVFCDKFAGTPEELAFVKEIQNRRAGQARYGHPVVE
ncbi:MAG: hypothetical protein WBM45_11550 [Woeseiaceae bacterium]